MGWRICHWQIMTDYNVCDVTLSVYPHRVSLKNMPGADIHSE
jgi:hypothetical protein